LLGGAWGAGAQLNSHTAAPHDAPVCQRLKPHAAPLGTGQTGRADDDVRPTANALSRSGPSDRPSPTQTGGGGAAAMPLLLVALWCCIAVANPQDPAPRRGGGGGATAAAAAAAVERAKALQQSDPIAAIEHAAAAAAMLGTGRPRVPAGKAPSAKAMLWAQAQIQLGAAYHTTIRHDEAASAYARALGVLEAAPRGTRDDTGRPLEMEILATKMER
jgi:hypothetical protein